MTRLTRRELIERALLTTGAAAGLGAAAYSPAHAAPRRRGLANDKIHVAVIGVNSRGMDHVSGYVDRDDVEIIAICDADEKAARKAIAAIEKKGKKAPRFEQDVRKLLEDKELHAVSIATPNHWHALGAIWAIQAGKDVYVEKPVSHNVFEGRKIVEAARKYNKICQTGTQIRSQKGSMDAIAYIHGGKIGKVTTARGLCYKSRGSIGKTEGPQPVPESIDYDLWTGPARMEPPRRNGKFGPVHYDWHWVWNYGNGDLGNQGIHQMDVARWALNKNEFPKTVMGLGGRFGYVDDGETPNTELIFMDYGDCQLVFEVRGLKTEKLKGAGVGNIVYGSEGTVVFTGYANAVAFDNDDKVVREFSGGGDHYDNFLSAVRSRKHTDLHADIEEGHLSSALCHLGNISYLLGESVPFSRKSQSFGDNKEAYETFARTEQHLAENGVNLQETNYRLGPKLSLDVKKERFKGNGKANEMLTRDYRKGFEVPGKV